MENPMQNFKVSIYETGIETWNDILASSPGLAAIQYAETIHRTGKFNEVFKFYVLKEDENPGVDIPQVFYVYNDFAPKKGDPQMNEPTPQTLEEILAAGNAILAQQRKARLQELEEQEARQAKIHEAILDAAESYLPAAVMEFAVVKQDEEGDEPYIADILLTIPNALPIEARFRNIGMDHADAESWKPIEGQRECLRIHNAGWTRPIFALPAVLAIATERYTPPPPPAPPPPTKTQTPPPPWERLFPGVV